VSAPGSVSGTSMELTLHSPITGGPVPYDVTFAYPRAADPNVTFACP
jgi:hypothetical protein